MDDELEEILQEFFTEADESLDELEQDLIKLETEAETGDLDSDMIDRIFRVMHTLKGGSGFLGLDVMTKLAHAGENLLDEIRAIKVVVNKDVMDALLQTNDELKAVLEIYKDGGDGTDLDLTALIADLERLACPSDAVVPPAAEAAAPVETQPVEEVVVETAAPVVENAPAEGAYVNEELLAELQGDDRLDEALDTDKKEETPAAEAEVSEPIVASGSVAEEAAAPVADAPAEGSYVNEELLAELQGDDRLDEALDTDKKEETPVAEAAAPVADAPAEGSYVNEELLAELQGDDRLDEALDADNKKESAPAAPAPEAPAPKKEVSAPVAEKAAPVVEETVELTRGKATPPERRDKSDRREKSTERRTKGRRPGEAAEVTIRVETSKLDKTMNLVGELVLARNTLERQLMNPELQNLIQEYEGYGSFVGNIEHISRVTKELQMSVLSTRMQPIKKVFDKMPRQVRELKTKLNKEVDLIVEGEMTEVDKTLVEELSDPMVHIIRNSLDHGIESPEDRREMGKSPAGTISVQAYYEGNKVVIRISDDGKGIDPEQIKQIALKKGVIDEHTAANMNDKDAVRLVMAAGFSTAEVVSDVSGRGVGMDVVNSSIQKIKGSVDIESEIGIGTTISIYLPLTLAIVQALVVESNKEGFAIPIGDISEVIRFVSNDVHKVNDRDVIELRGEMMPLYYLSEMTKLGPLPQLELSEGEVKAKIVEKEVRVEEEVAATTDTEGEGMLVVDEATPVPPAAPVVEENKVADPNAASELAARTGNKYIVVVREASNVMGVVTDELLGQEEAVIKPISETFDYNKAVSGATISGDGAVHMILDVPYLIKDMTLNR